MACTRDNLDARVNFGYALGQRGQTAEAIAQYEKALEIDPNNAAVHNNLGSRLASIGRTADAIDQYRRALEIKPDYIEAHANLGNALFRQEKFADAEAEYRSALRSAEAANRSEISAQLRDSIRHAQSAAGQQRAPRNRPYPLLACDSSPLGCCMRTSTSCCVLSGP